MLLSISQQVYSDLSSFAGLTALLTNGADSIRPLIAEEEDGNSFVTYYIKYSGKITKGAAAEYQLIVQSWANTYDASLAIADQVANALSASNNYSAYLSADPNFSEQQIIYTEQTFNIKK